MALNPTTATGDPKSWEAEVLEQEKVPGMPCTQEKWKDVWPDFEGEHKEFDERHIAAASVAGEGNVEVIIPWRFTRGFHKAGAPHHYMQYIYLRDQNDAIRAIIKYEPSDTAFPARFSAASVQGATSLTPFSIDNIHGVWRGASIAYP